MSGDQRGALRPGLAVRLVLVGGRRPPKPPRYLGAGLVPLAQDRGPGGVSWTREEPHFDGRGELLAPATGTVAVRMTLTRRDGEVWVQAALSMGQGTILEVVEQEGVQTFEVSLDPEAYERTRALLEDP